MHWIAHFLFQGLLKVDCSLEAGSQGRAQGPVTCLSPWKKQEALAQAGPYLGRVILLPVTEFV